MSWNISTLVECGSLHCQPSQACFSSHQHLQCKCICLATVEGTRAYISTLTLLGKFLYIGASDGEIRCLKRASQQNDDTGGNILVANGNGAVKSLVFSCGILFSAHQDHKIRAWKIIAQELDDEPKCKHQATLPTLGDRAIRALFASNNVRVRRHKTSTWVHHNDTVSALALSSDGSLLYSVSWDRTLKVWRTKDFKCLESVENAHSDAINAVAASREGEIMTGSTDGKVKVWSRSLGRNKLSLVGVLEKHRAGVNALALNSDGSVLFSGSSDKSVIVWERRGSDDAKYSPAGVLKGHSKAVLCLCTVGVFLFSGSADKTMRVWKGNGKVFACLAVVEGHHGPVKCLTATFAANSASSSGFLLYSGSLDCTVKVWQVSLPLTHGT